MEPKAARIKELRLIAVVIAAIVLLQCIAPYIAIPYRTSVFAPLQQCRSTLLHAIPFSLGDCLYLAALLYLVWKLIAFFRCRNKDAGSRLLELLRFIRRIAAVYLLLMLLWGVLYEQPKLYRSLELPDLKDLQNEELMAFDSLLIGRMNEGQASFRYSGLQSCNEVLSECYRKQGAPLRTKAKPTLLGNGLAYFGVQGYFNPFTGEAQVNTGEPDFMMPFLIAHEMAHQTGIAAEDDANLAAYIACMESGRPDVRYSASFNIWLYVHRRVRHIDSNRANQLKEQLNTRSLAQLDTLRRRSDAYHTLLDDASSFLFDAYLKMEKQEAGINSYRNVAWSALAWEKQKNNIYFAH